MSEAPAVSTAEIRRAARRGVAVIFAVLVPLTALFDAIVFNTGNLLWISAPM